MGSYDGVTYAPMAIPSSPQRPARITGKYISILNGFLVLTVPLTAIAAVLLGMIFHYQVKYNVIDGTQIQSPRTQPESGVYYVKLNPTFLMKIASLSSTIATFLTTFAVGLAAYPLASALLKNTRKGTPDLLLSPYQYYLTLDLIENAGYPSVWRWLQFAFSKRARQTKPPTQSMNVGRVACITLILGGLVFAADTWLHFTTKPFEFVQIDPVRQDAALYSRVLSSNCSDQDNTYADQSSRECTMRPNIRGGTFLNPITTFEVFNNVSNTTSVNTYSDVSPPHAFLGVPENGVSWRQNFVAKTISVSSKCHSAVQECNLSRDNLTNGAGVIFDCPKYPAWWGLLVGAPPAFNKQYFTDATGSKNASGTSSKVSNPFYVGMNGLTTRSVGAALKIVQTKDPGVVAQEFGGVAYLHFCEVTVYDVEYTAINGSITRFKAEPASGSVSTALVTADRNINAGNRQLLDAADLGSLVADTAQDMADVFAIEYSRVLLRTVSGALEPAPVIEAHRHSRFIVARVPATPLYTLIAAIGLMIAFGVFLTIVALVSARAKEVEEVRARLSVQHLVAERMEPELACLPVENLDQVFKSGEYGGVSKRIGIGKRDPRMGGWETKIWYPAT